VFPRVVCLPCVVQFEYKWLACILQPRRFNTVCKDTALIETSHKPSLVFPDLIHWVEAARYLGITLNTQFTWSALVSHVEIKAVERLGVFGPSLILEVACLSETVWCYINKSSVLWWTVLARSGCSLPTAVSGSSSVFSSVFALRLTHLGALVKGKFISIWGFYSSPTTSHKIFGSNLLDIGNP
jgi:hypothetical protein